MTSNKILTATQARELLGVNKITLYSYIKSGELPAHKLGGKVKSNRRWRLWRSDVVAFRDGKGR